MPDEGKMLRYINHVTMPTDKITISKVAAHLKKFHFSCGTKFFLLKAVPSYLINVSPFSM